MTLDLEQAAQWMGSDSRVAGSAGGWSIDTRTLAPGDAYFALPGSAHDGHSFVPRAFERGAVCAVVDREHDFGGATIQVRDTGMALQQLAREARRAWGGDVVGVTGSAGKTTTKDIIARFLSVREPVGKTVGNFNNHIGLPLSILRIPDDARIAVLEIGMNHAGEIRELASIATPRVAVVTNVGYAHVEFFESIEGVAAAKRELVESLSPAGIAILNADDSRVVRFAAVHPGRSITYGFSAEADFRAEDAELLPDRSRFRCCGVQFDTPLTGRHGVLNVLAGIATASVFGIEPAELVHAAETIPIGPMRGERTERNGFTILNDAYNANPEAMRGMLDVLAATPGDRHVAVLGEMLELGSQSEALHRAVGRHAAAMKIDVLVGIRGASQYMLDEAIREGLPPKSALFFGDSRAAGVALRSLLKPGDAILFKGSRGVGVERALATLLEVEA